MGREACQRTAEGQVFQEQRRLPKAVRRRDAWMGQELSSVHEREASVAGAPWGWGGLSHAEVRGRQQRAPGTSVVRGSEGRLLMGS